jgi:hypothetical protein
VSVVSLARRLEQITFSALGQQAPLDEKKKWDPDFAKRRQMKAFLDHLIPEFSVRLGGTTSIDVTKQGIDKGYGIRKLRGILGVAVSEMIFVGDALFPAGNDYPAKQAGAFPSRSEIPMRRNGLSKQSSASLAMARRRRVRGGASARRLRGAGRARPACPAHPSRGARRGRVDVAQGRRSAGAHMRKPQEGQMQLGMVGLGRMGGNMVRRLVSETTSS